MVFFFKQKTAYEMRISDWSSDVPKRRLPLTLAGWHKPVAWMFPMSSRSMRCSLRPLPVTAASTFCAIMPRSEEHTSELQSLMRISYAVFCLKKKNTIVNKHDLNHINPSHKYTNYQTPTNKLR